MTMTATDEELNQKTEEEPPEPDKASEELSDENKGDVSGAEPETKDKTGDEDKGEEGEKDENTEEETAEYTEDQFQELVKKEASKQAQSIKDKELKPLYEERDNLRKETSQLKAQLQDKTMDRKFKLLFEADSEEQGEDKAKQLDQARREVYQEMKGYYQDKDTVARLKVENEKMSGDNELAAKYLKACEVAYSIRNPEFKMLPKDDPIVIELLRAKDPEHFEDIAKRLRTEHSVKATRKPFKPDSSRAGGTGLLPDKTWLAKWNSGELPATRENLLKAQKLLERE